MSYVPRREEAGPIEGTYLPCGSRTYGRSAAQLVGSFVTNASTLSMSLLKDLSKAPRVVG